MGVLIGDDQPIERINIEIARSDPAILRPVQNGELFQVSRVFDDPPVAGIRDPEVATRVDRDIMGAR